MIFKSEKRFYDEKQQKYTLPLCSFDTDAICVTTVDVRTGKVREDNFYSEYIRRHVPHVLKHQPERFQELVNKGKIIRPAYKYVGHHKEYPETGDKQEVSNTK